jgi:hypothetical protein
MLGFQKIISLFLSFIIGFFTYSVSFITSSNDNNFQIINGYFSVNSVLVNGEIISTKTEGDEKNE